LYVIWYIIEYIVVYTWLIMRFELPDSYGYTAFYSEHFYDKAYLRPGLSYKQYMHGHIRVPGRVGIWTFTTTRYNIYSKREKIYLVRYKN
jgi:hypothetical protein